MHLSRVGRAVSLLVCPVIASVLSPGDAMIFSLDDLSKATNNFSKEKMIGKGGFGRVFRGKLRYSDVAVKVLNTVSEIHMISNNRNMFSFSAAGCAIN